MRYWAYFAAKLVVAAGCLYGVLLLINRWMTKEEVDAFPRWWMVEVQLLLMAWFLLCVGALYLIVRDQRYRCRVCLHRLRMPIETGSWGFMLQLGRPRIEYICPYGHGTLTQEELDVSPLENPEWTQQSGNMWDDLYAASKQSQDER